MKKIFIVITSLLVLSFSQAWSQPAHDYVNVPGPISFGNVNYYLAWSANPVKNYYKQQYIAKGDSLGRFSKMLLIDVLDDSISVKDLVDLKISALDQRKQTDAALNYKLTQSPDSIEYIIDYIGTEGFPVVDYAEWNAYRYAPFIGKGGKKGVILFGVSVRSYGNNPVEFIANVDKLREKVMTELMACKIPGIAIN